MTETFEERVDRREFAKLLGITERSLDRHRDKLPAPLPLKPPYQRGARLLWSRAAVLAFISARAAVMS